MAGHSHTVNGVSHEHEQIHHVQDEDDDGDQQEQAHFNNVVRAFRRYEEHANRRIDKLVSSFKFIPVDHQRRVPGFLGALDKARRCITKNQEFINAVLSGSDMFDDQPEISAAAAGLSRERVSEADIEKVESTIRQFVRDWSEEGATERANCYKPILDAVLTAYPNPQSDIKVLIPGAGMGRLTWEFAKAGYAAQGNEFSYFMLLASNYVLNNSPSAEHATIYPFVHQLTNIYQREDMTRPIKVPDVYPGDLPPNANFSMSAGDFLECYHDGHGEWDCVASCFFLDTAKNIIAYIELIAQILKPGGLFVNLGPLLYHFSDMPDFLSVELSWEELRAVLTSYGFTVLTEERKTCGYTQNKKSMFSVAYNCVFFTAVKN